MGGESFHECEMQSTKVLNPNISSISEEHESDSVESIDLNVHLNPKKKKKEQEKLQSILKQHQNELPGNPVLPILKPGSIRIAVFLKHEKDDGEKRNVELIMENGGSMTSRDIKHEMMKKLSIPKTSAHMFAIWLISPFLELQLKHNHKPLHLRRQWRELLDKYSNSSDCSETEKELDEPVLVFQRNCFIPVAEEEKETDANVLKLLFEEACYNVLNARYPVPVSDAEMLGGILLRYYEGEFDPNVHKSGVFRKRLNEFLPYYAIGSNKISQYIHSSGTEKRLLAQYQIASQILQDKISCYKKFLDYCHTLDFYGSAFFHGSCFQEGTENKFWKSDHLPITIGVNRYGITLFQGECESVLTHLTYGDFSWNCKQNVELEEEGTRIDLFLIEYDDEEKVRQIDVDTKKASLIDAMVQSCVQFQNWIPGPKKMNVGRKNVRRISFAK